MAVVRTKKPDPKALWSLLPLLDWDDEVTGRKDSFTGERYTDPKFGFSFTYPQVRHWKLEQTQPGFVLFVNKFLQSTLAIMAYQMPEVIEDVHDLEVQLALTMTLVRSLKRHIPTSSDFKFGSKANIVNPHNRIKGFKLIFPFKLPGQDMKGQYVTYISNQIQYDVLATTPAQHYDTEDKVFFEPVIQSFTFEV